MENNKYLKYGKWLVYLLAIALIAQVLTSQFLAHDETLSKVEAWLFENDQLIDDLGKIHNVSLTKRVSVSKSERVPSYKLYNFIVTGEKNKALVVIQVNSIKDSSNKMEFVIKTISVK